MGFLPLHRGAVRGGADFPASGDPEHAMLRRAVEDGVWDGVMVALHMMHQNARSLVFPQTLANRVGSRIGLFAPACYLRRMTKNYKPGERAPRSGVDVITGPRGGRTREE